MADIVRTPDGVYLDGKYTSNEAIADVMNWVPDVVDKAIFDTGEQTTPALELLAKHLREEERTVYQEAFRKKLDELAEFSFSDGCVIFFSHYCTPDERQKLDNGESGMLDTLARILADVAVECMK